MEADMLFWYPADACNHTYRIVRLDSVASIAELSLICTVACWSLPSRDALYSEVVLLPVERGTPKSLSYRDTCRRHLKGDICNVQSEFLSFKV